MKRILTVFAVFCALSAAAQKPYFTLDEMPDLVKCLPPPPDTSDVAFKYDVIRYEWGKEMRADPERVAEVRRDAVWDLDTLAAIFSVPFGLEISASRTPQIHKAFMDAISTIEQIRVKPKEHYMRTRPFVLFREPSIFPEDDDWIGKEGSYPSGHTIRGWGAALVLAEINPAASEKIFERGWRYGDNRVIAGAHWQSDVDASRAAADIAYSLVQTSPAYRKQIARARKEFRKIARQ